MNQSVRHISYCLLRTCTFRFHSSLLKAIGDFVRDLRNELSSLVFTSRGRMEWERVVYVSPSRNTRDNEWNTGVARSNKDRDPAQRAQRFPRGIIFSFEKGKYDAEETDARSFGPWKTARLTRAISCWSANRSFELFESAIRRDNNKAL